MRHRYLLAWGIALTACSTEPNTTHALDVTVYGEDFIEAGIPADATADGWAISFQKFAVTLEDVSVGGPMIEIDQPVDLIAPTEGTGRVLATVEVPEGTIEEATFTIARIEIEGTATDGDVTKSFAWTFDQAVAYSECEPGPDVEEGTSVAFQITVHADHLFYDSLVSEEPDVRFAALAAADADGDDIITQGELTAVTNLGSYDAGSEGAENLWAYLSALAETLGHANGEGHCNASPAADD